VAQATMKQNAAILINTYQTVGIGICY